MWHTAKRGKGEHTQSYGEAFFPCMGNCCGRFRVHKVNKKTKRWVCKECGNDEIVVGYKYTYKRGDLK